MLFNKHTILDIRGMRVPFWEMQNMFLFCDRLAHQKSGQIKVFQETKIANNSSGMKSIASYCHHEQLETPRFKRNPFWINIVIGTNSLKVSVKYQGRNRFALHSCYY
jgi:hypothetical protein